MSTLKPIINDLQNGKMVILVDEKKRENEADLICAAEFVTPKIINFMARYGRGLICVPLTQKKAFELNLSLMKSTHAQNFQHCNFTESVDLRKGISTGISAFDRAKTIKALASPTALGEDFARPGHVFPLIEHPKGLRFRRGHTEGTLHLLRLAKLKEVAVICEIMDDDGKMMSGAALQHFAQKHKLKIVRMEDLVAGGFGEKGERGEESPVEARMPTPYGEFRVRVCNEYDGKEHLVFILGEAFSQKAPPLIRIHSECLTGDVFGSLRCDCNKQLHMSLKKIAEEGSGILLYMRQEGRGIGLVNKLKAYNLQDHGYDTVEANQLLGFTADSRDYNVAAKILKTLGLKKVRLMTNNPQKIEGLEKSGISVIGRVPIEIVTKGSLPRKYLRIKKEKLGHLFSLNLND